MIIRIRALHKPRGRIANILLAASYLFLAVGILALSYAGYVYADAHTFQAVEKARFEEAPRSKAPTIVTEGGVIGEIEIARIGLDAIIVQGDSPGILRRAVGHIISTPLPGELGNVTLAGHRDSFFRPLRNLVPGDTISLRTVNGDFRYQVESTEVVPPHDMNPLLPTSARTLTLVTCYPFYYVGPAPKRFIVHAREVGALPQLSAR